MTSQQVRNVPVARSLPGPGSYMCGLTWDGEYLWHSDQEAGKIFALDRVRGTVARVLTCPKARADLAWHDGWLCQVGGRPKRLLLLHPQTGAVAEEKEVAPPSGRLCGVETGPDGMWMGLRNPSVVQLRDFATMTVRREYPVEGSPSGLTWADGVVLYAEFETGVVRAVAAATGKMLAAVTVEGRPTGLTWDGSELWYCDFAARRIKAVDLDDVLRETYSIIK